MMTNPPDYYYKKYGVYSWRLILAIKLAYQELKMWYVRYSK